MAKSNGEAILKSEPHYRLLFENMSQGVVFEDAERKIIAMNPAAERILGQSLSAFRGGFFGDKERPVIRTDDTVFPVQEEPCLIARETGREVRDVIMGIFNPRENAYRWINLNATPLFREGATQAYQVCMIFSDITEHKRIEKALAATEEALQISEANYQTLVEKVQNENDYLQAVLDNLPVGVMFTDGVGRSTRRNARSLQVWRGEKPHLMSQTDCREYQAWWPETKRKVEPEEWPGIRVLRGEASKGEVISATFDIERFDGTKGTVIFNAAPIISENGTMTGTVAVAQDITEFKQAVETLRETVLIAEKQAGELDAIITSIAEGVVVYDQSGQIIRINDFARNIFGFSCSDYYLNDQDLGLTRKMYKADGAAYESNEILLYRALQGEIIRNEEVFFYRNGRPIWISATLAPIRDRNHNATGVVFTFADITERKQKVDEILASERELLEVTLNSLDEGVMATNGQGQVVLINEAAAKLTGYSRTEAIGAPLQEILYIFGDQTSKPHRITHNQWEFNNSILMTRDLHEIPVAIHSSPIRTPEGVIIGTVTVFQDISEKQKILQERLRAQQLESLGILAGGIAHDFNNVLAAILSNLQLAILKLNKNEDIRSYLLNMVETTRKASDLTKQLLTFSKGGAPVRKDAALIDLIKDTGEFVLRGSKIKVEFAIAPDLWTASVDEGQISQVIHNLVINAKQAMPEGGSIELKAENIIIGSDSRFTPGDYVKITVKDQGVGISEKNLAKIFEPFFTTHQDGNGLGLTISYSIIKRHHGYIEVESQEGRGTAFFIYLPAAKERLAPAQSQLEVAASGGGIKILLMDDEEKIRNAVGKILEYYSYQVITATDGAEAIELYKRAKESHEPFDVVVMDLTIPGGMGGQEAITYLRDIDPNIKAIVSSGYADSIVVDYERFGFGGVVCKPYKIDELLAVLQQVIVSTTGDKPSALAD